MAEGNYFPARLHTPNRLSDVKMRYLGTPRVLAVLCGQIIRNPVCLQTVNPWLLWGRPSWILCTVPLIHWKCWIIPAQTRRHAQHGRLECYEATLYEKEDVLSLS